MEPLYFLAVIPAIFPTNGLCSPEETATAAIANTNKVIFIFVVQ